MNSIEIENLTREYHGPKGWFNAVDDLSLSVSTGEVFAFLGKNGAGKTTTIKILLGLTMPTSGDWSILGGEISDPSIRKRIGFLPEEHSFYPHLSVREVLFFYGNLFGIKGNKLKSAVGEVIKTTGLTGRETDKLRYLSKGLVQRVGLAQAMINEPDLLILDEPSSGLDPVGIQEFRDAIGHIKESGKSIFLNSHQLSEVEKLADRIGIINEGRLIKTGKLDELLSGEGGVEMRISIPNDQKVRDELERIATKCWIDDESGAFVLVMPDEDSVPDVMSLIRDGGSKLLSVLPKRATLEQFFIDTVSPSPEEGGGN